MKYNKPDLKIAKFTIDDAILAEYISSAEPSFNDDENSPLPGFETLSDAIDIILDN